MTLSRRKFIQLSSLGSASLMVPEFLKGFGYSPVPLAGNKVLVVVQLSGGNDGLNTVIPYRNDLYYKARPRLGIRKENAFTLSDEAGLHPKLPGLKALFDDARLAIINGVGYPQPDRSHFRSMDIWQTGSSPREVLQTGWLGRYLDGAGMGNDHSAMAIEVDDTLSLAMKGAEKSGIAVTDIRSFHENSSNSYFRKLASHDEEHHAKLADYLYKTLRNTGSAADYIYAQSKIYNSTATYPATTLGRSLHTIGSLIISNAETRVYYVSHGSFDTHVNQADRQAKLLPQLDDALTALVTDLKLNNRFNDVLIMTFSEFGRRVAQNASNGTDHGTASNMFLISGGLKRAGLYNPFPSLEDLDEGDLKHQIDFRQVYATILDKWLQADSKEVLGHKFDHLSFI